MEKTAQGSPTSFPIRTFPLEKMANKHRRTPHWSPSNAETKGFSYKTQPTKMKERIKMFYHLWSNNKTCDRVVSAINPLPGPVIHERRQTSSKNHGLSASGAWAPHGVPQNPPAPTLNRKRSVSGWDPSEPRKQRVPGSYLNPLRVDKTKQRVPYKLNIRWDNDLSMLF